MFSDNQGFSDGEDSCDQVWRTYRIRAERSTGREKLSAELGLRGSANSDPHPQKSLPSIVLFESPTLWPSPCMEIGMCPSLHSGQLLPSPLPGSQALTCSRIYHLPFLPPVTPTFLLAHFLAPSLPSVRTPGRRPTLGNMAAMLLRHSWRFSSRSFCLSVQAFRRRSCRRSIFSRKT